MKVAELVAGEKLDYWVGKALGLTDKYFYVGGYPRFKVPHFVDCPNEDPEFGDTFAPSTRPDHGVPIIDMESIAVVPWRGLSGVVWAAYMPQPNGGLEKVEEGYFEVPCGDVAPTMLVAAMRAFVTSKFGDEVPDEP